MPTLTIRNISEEVHRALRVRAAQHGQSMEVEVREILESAVCPHGRVKLGSLLADMARQARLSDEEFVVFERVRECRRASWANAALAEPGESELFL